MSFTNPIIEAGLSGLTDLFADRAVTPVEVFQSYQSRIDGLDGALGCYVAQDKAAAEQAAHESAERWAKGTALSMIDGAPIAVKANIAVAGLPWHAGIGAFRDRIAEDDAPVVAQLRAAGAVILGLVNMHEGAFGALTDNPWFGRTQNPWKHGYSAGGSSGGSAAAVSAGLCAAALGSDTLGSVRIPSSFTGIFGHKPTQGLISTGDVIPMSWTLDHVGTHGRSADDCARLLAAACGAEAELASEIARPSQLESLIDAPMAVLRLDGFPCDDVQKAALAAAVAKARHLGFEVEEVALDGYDFREAVRLGVIISGAESMADHALALASDPQGFSEEFRRNMAYGGEQTAAVLAGAYRDLAGLAEAARAALGAYQGLLLPTTPCTAYSFEAGQSPDVALFTTLGNVVGLPATAFPIGLSADELPLSVQALAWDDETSLGLARALAEPVGAPPSFRG
jgi:aspartyl-tRNA(Asn)/glutamyl-tRNA(Gln) amidotransferase subunit A